MNNSKLTHAKLESNLDRTYSEYSNLVRLEKEYMKKLRELKLEYENAEKIYQWFYQYDVDCGIVKKIYLIYLMSGIHLHEGPKDKGVDLEKMCHKVLDLSLESAPLSMDEVSWVIEEAKRQLRS